MYYLVKLFPNQDPETLLSHESASVLHEIAQIHYATMDSDKRFYMYLCEGEKDINGWYDYQRYIPVRG